MADKAIIHFSSKLLTDEIQVLTGKRGFQGGTFSYTPVNNTEGWYYKLTNVTNASTDLIAGVILQKKDTGIAVGSSPATIHTDDVVRFLWIYNTGTIDGSSASTDSVYICLDGDTAAYNLVDALEIPTGQVWFGRMPNTTVANIHAITAQANGGGASSSNVQCIVAAVIDDVA